MAFEELMGQKGFALPQMSFAPTYENITKMLQSIGSLPSLRESIQPEISGLTGEGGPILAPFLSGIREQTGRNVAAAQTEASKRLITGSDIESQEMAAARTGGLQAESALRSQIAQSLLDLIFKAQAGDIQAATTLRTILAQAMGEELGAGRDIEMSRAALAANQSQADANRSAAREAAIIGAIGQVLGGAAEAFSDKRLKKKIKKIGEWMGLSIVSFLWNRKAGKLGIAPGKSGIGLIAQEVKERFPKSVREVKGYMAIDYRMLPTDLVASVSMAAGR